MEKANFKTTYLPNEAEYPNNITTIMPMGLQIPIKTTLSCQNIHDNSNYFNSNHQTMIGEYNPYSIGEHSKNYAYSSTNEHNMFYKQDRTEEIVSVPRNSCNNSVEVPIWTSSQSFDNAIYFSNHTDHSKDGKDDKASKKRKKVVKPQDRAKRIRRKVADPSEWKRNKSRLQKCDGKPYINYKGIEQPAKHPKPSKCKNCRFRCSEHFAETERQKLCSDFWKLALYNRQMDYLLKYIKESKPQRRRRNVPVDKQRKSSRSYYLLKKKGVVVRVCKSYFERTLCISNGPIQLTFHKKSDSKIETTNRDNSNVGQKPIKNGSDVSLLLLNHKIEKLTKRNTMKSKTMGDEQLPNNKTRAKKATKLKTKKSITKDNEQVQNNIRESKRKPLDKSADQKEDSEIGDTSYQHSNENQIIIDVVSHKLNESNDVFMHHNNPPGYLFVNANFQVETAETNSIRKNKTLENVEIENRNSNLNCQLQESSEGNDNHQNSVGIINNANKKNLENVQFTDELKKPRKRRKIADPTCWKRNLTKQLKTEGKPYTNRRGVLLPGKIPQPIDCQKCRFKCAENFSDEDRQNICSSYWKLTDFPLQKDFILKYVRETEPQRPRKNVAPNKQRKSSRSYFFLRNERDILRVCKTFFERTLCISNGSIEFAFKNSLSGVFIGVDKRGKKDPVNKTKSEDIKFAMDQIRKYKKATGEDSKDSQTPVTKIHAAYAQKCLLKSRTVVTISVFRKIYNKTCPLK